MVSSHRLGTRLQVAEEVNLHRREFGDMNPPAICYATGWCSGRPGFIPAALHHLHHHLPYNQHPLPDLVALPLLLGD